MTDLPPHYTILTNRLRLEPFAPEHAPLLNAINNEPEVMEFLSDGTPETMEKTHEGIARVCDRWQRLGHSWWTIIERETETIIGAACLQNVSHIEGAELEIGWRLSTAATGKGYATEAGRAAARFAFDVIGVDHVISVANPKNVNSQRVMQRIGMTYRGRETHYGQEVETYTMPKANLP
ncbi:Protein N-acetyltransferase, RimJ/RimL family [Yoonia rosea]|uniref:Protein N-acetyltransferase, RimJ/RimL family n=1 Tax=Yoonia rosea TaxID=287098 RepID=A0A1R3X125_9RHOB|nr:GNAT family N-acetyltransferase [Yoonia rosea]SIT84531.1 Protein N-acetyltransferase, RimJ/RimL family [Yoonia rosea]